MTSGTTASTAWPLLRQDYFQVYRLQRSVPEMAVANARMHLKPLVRIAQSADTFRSSASRVTQYACSRATVMPSGGATARRCADTRRRLGHDLTEKGQSGFPQGYGRSATRRPDAVEPAAAASRRRSTRTVIATSRSDRAITEHHSRPSGLPLILAALPEQQSHFRRLSLTACCRGHRDRPERIERQ